MFWNLSLDRPRHHQGTYNQIANSEIIEAFCAYALKPIERTVVYPYGYDTFRGTAVFIARKGAD